MDEDRKTILRLDGSHGMGQLVRVTVVTADKVHGTVETAYEMPYSLLNEKILPSAVGSKYILGYGVLRLVPPGEKTVVLTTGEDGLRAEYDNGDGQ